jgi:hypothetical protein
MSIRRPFTLALAGLLLAGGAFFVPSRAHAVPACEIDDDCEDGNACTQDLCSEGACQFLPVSCNDEDACTMDYCDPSEGCTYEFILCDDHDECTDDTCDATAGCVFSFVVCDDGNACTDESCDPELGCSSTPVSCDDGDACTLDTCDPELGCAHAPIPGGACDPGAGGTPVAGSRLRVDDVGDPRGKRNAATLTDTAISFAGVDPTVTGATAEIGKPGGPSTVITLAADGWVKAGSGAIPGYKYKSRSEGVLAARLRDGKSIRFSARASGIYGLNGQPQGQLGVIFRVGSAKYCAIFGGTIRRDDGEHFVAVRAPAPQACPVFANNPNP